MHQEVPAAGLGLEAHVGHVGDVPLAQGQERLDGLAVVGVGGHVALVRVRVQGIDDAVHRVRL